MQNSLEQIIDEIWAENKKYFRSRLEVDIIVRLFVNELKLLINNYEELDFSENFKFTLSERGKIKANNHKALKRYNHLELLKKHREIKYQYVNDFID